MFNVGDIVYYTDQNNPLWKGPLKVVERFTHYNNNGSDGISTYHCTGQKDITGVFNERELMRKEKEYFWVIIDKSSDNLGRYETEEAAIAALNAYAKDMDVSDCEYEIFLMKEVRQLKSKITWA